MQAENKRRLPKLEELLNEKKPLNYLNYTKEKYNILTLKEHDDYYRKYQEQIPVYVREQPDWGKSLYKRKNNKVNQYNYILYRNAKNIRERRFPHDRTTVIPRSDLYRPHKARYSQTDNLSVTEGRGRQVRNDGREKSAARENSVAESLPFIRRKDNAQDRTSAIQRRSLSSHCGSKGRKGASVSKASGSSVKATHTEKLLRRAERLGKFLQSIRSEEGRELAKAYGKELIERLKASDLTKERMKIAMNTSVEDLQKTIEDSLGIKLDEEEKKEEEKKKEEGEKKEEEEKSEVAISDIEERAKE
eukprot:TRINITY_DN9740_c0_g1_i15.p1 TRINITY_DN9740_c0_g1~~TRINITY_DN9740_c0_g1_i15.p1  ORF type:complete len:304 (-),score=111.98 TRINITY_DN9740_c0_g1_i15:266-1177(-)